MSMIVEMNNFPVVCHAHGQQSIDSLFCAFDSLSCAFHWNILLN